MKRVISLFCVLMLLIGIPGLIYLGLVIYYQDSFMYGTWINGIYCTGKTVEEAARELEQNFEYEELKVVTPAGVEVIHTEELAVTYDFESALKAYRQKQNPLKWFSHILGGHQKEEILPDMYFLEERLEEWIKDTEICRRNLEADPDSLSIVMTEAGYKIEEKKEKILNTELAKKQIKEALYTAQKEISLMAEDYYFTREETPEMQEIRNFFAKIDKFQNLSLTYQIKEDVKKVTPCEAAGWLAADENGEVRLNQKGKFVLDKSAIERFVDGLAKEYDTWRDYTFKTHDGKEIHIYKGNYGIQIDKKKETAFLLKYLTEPEETIREPEYLRDYTFEGRNHLEDTYVEIDLTAQKMFYFEDSELELETEVVTGCEARSTATPEMVCYVYHKSKDAVLRGKDYRTRVSYWMPVYGGIGIHDASWRKEFGGDIYKKSGSHGCINTPSDIMGVFYEKVQEGTPVIIHY